MFSKENCAIRVAGETRSSVSENGEEIPAFKFAEKFVDLGDFIGVKGEVFRTHKGELTIFATEFEFL
jgi:lysyl-tRNA synthetase class 2